MRRNYATISAVYYLPGFKNRSVLNTLLGGFQISGIVTQARACRGRR